MGSVKKPESVLLFAGIITLSKNLEKLQEILLPLGEIEDRTETLSFDTFSKYYEKEMGEGLQRLWVTFKGLRSPENLHLIKLESNRIEESHSVHGKRTINIDPGYISLSNVVLFTTKNYYHRIYIGKGIYAEVTLFYRNLYGFQPFQWTYPDYKSDAALRFFNTQRQKLYLTRRKEGIK